MPAKTVYQARIDYLQILDEQGKLDQTLAKDTLTDDEVKQLYEQMIICREFDEQAFKLQRSGRMGTFPQNKGQEAGRWGQRKPFAAGLITSFPFTARTPPASCTACPCITCCSS